MSQNIIQKGERHWAPSLRDWSFRYPAYSARFEGHVYLTCLANSQAAIESIMTRSFSDGRIICEYEELGADLVFDAKLRGCNLLEFDSSFRAFFKNEPDQTACHDDFVRSFAKFSEVHPEVLFVADLLHINDPTRHSRKRCVFSNGNIEVTTPTVSFKCSLPADESLKLNSAYSKYLDSKSPSKPSQLEEILFDALKDLDPEHSEPPEIVS